MIVYGKNVWTQLQSDPDRILRVYVMDGIKDTRIFPALKKLGLSFTPLSRQKMDRLTQSTHHQGIALEVKDIPMLSLDELLSSAKDPGLIVVLDEIQDPHNLGAILRSCDCAGVSGVILPKHNSAPLSPTAIKASTGAAFTVPICTVTNLSQTLKTLKKSGYWVVGTGFENARDYREGIYDVPLVVVIGNEGKGMSPLVSKQCDYLVKLPMAGTISSLNASVACGILLYKIFDVRNPL